jgi:hypothetical protein
MDMPDDLGRSYAFVQDVEEARLRRLGPEQRAAIYILRSFELIFRDAKDWNAALDRHRQLTGDLLEAMAGIIREGESFKDAILRREIAQIARSILDMRPIQ